MFWFNNSFSNLECLSPSAVFIYLHQLLREQWKSFKTSKSIEQHTTKYSNQSMNENQAEQGKQTKLSRVKIHVDKHL